MNKLSRKQWEEVGQELLEKHGLGDWSFTINRRLQRAMFERALAATKQPDYEPGSGVNVVMGYCFSEYKLIWIAPYLIKNHPPEQICDTILHEIAHALTPGAGHGNAWVKKAKELGCTGRRSIKLITD
jgi:hypothetical protein